MTTTQAYGTDVVRPTPGTLSSSILDHATVKVLDEGDSFALRSDSGLWPSYNCLDMLVPTAMCPDPTLTETGEFKQFATAGWVPGFTFANMGGVQCATLGLDEDDMEAEIKRAFEASEGRGIEQALLGTRFIASEADAKTRLGQDVGWDAPVDITPPAQYNLLVTLGLLEGYAARHYVGVPIIHMPRAASTILAGLGAIEWRDGKAFTKSGAKVAIGGGYDPETIDTGDWDGTFDMYATGAVYIEKSALIEHQSWTLDKARDARAAVPGVPANGQTPAVPAITADPGLANNTTIALVERMYRVAIDCLVVKATGKV